LAKQINIYLITFVSLLIAVLTIHYVPYLVVILFAAFLFLIFQRNFIILLTIVLFISFTSFAFKGARDVVTVLSIAALFYLFLKQYGLKYSEYPAVPMEVSYFFLLLIVTLITSTLFSTSTGQSLASLLHTIIFFMICYLFYSLIRDKNKIYIYIFGIIIAVLIIDISIYSDFIKAGFAFHLNNGILARFAGVYSNPNVVGLTLFIASCFILALFYVERFKSRRSKFFLGVLLLNSAAAFIITDSRAAGIALLIGFIFILSILNRKILRRVLLFGLPILLFLFLIPPIQNAIFILLRVDEGSRLHLWGEGLRMFSDHFLTGVGPGMYGHFYVSYTSSFYIMLAEKLQQLYRGVPNPHNFIIAMAAENGIMGMITAISMFALYFFFAFKCIKGYKNIDRDYYVLSVVIFGIGLGVLENSFFEVMGIMSYGFITHDLPFWLTYIILIFMYQRLKKIKKFDIAANVQPVYLKS